MSNQTAFNRRLPVVIINIGEKDRKKCFNKIAIANTDTITWNTCLKVRIAIHCGWLSFLLNGESNSF